MVGLILHDGTMAQRCTKMHKDWKMPTHPLQAVSSDFCIPSDLGRCHICHIMHSRDSRSSGVQARPANRCIRVSGTESIRASQQGLATGLTDLQMGYLWIPMDTWIPGVRRQKFALSRYDPWDDPPSNPFPLLSRSKVI